MHHQTSLAARPRQSRSSAAALAIERQSRWPRCRRRPPPAIRRQRREPSRSHRPRVVPPGLPRRRWRAPEPRRGDGPSRLSLRRALAVAARARCRSRRRRSARGRRRARPLQTSPPRPRSPPLRHRSSALPVASQHPRPGPPAQRTPVPARRREASAPPIDVQPPVGPSGGSGPSNGRPGIVPASARSISSVKAPRADRASSAL